jgi:hypothetical protein
MAKKGPVMPVIQGILSLRLKRVSQKTAESAILARIIHKKKFMKSPSMASPTMAIEKKWR